MYIPFEVGPSWQKALEKEWEKPYLAELALFVEKERRSGIPIYPPKELVFNAFKQTPYESVKVVIMGQDPYHGPGQAHGLSFSVPEGVPPPPSLKNIYKEMGEDLNLTPPKHGCLLSWARQGVMLLNATLTVQQSNPMSHHGKGWEQFTDAVIKALCTRKDPLVFVLWGSSAQKKCEQVQEMALNPQHQILKAPHPSPLSASKGFFGSHHFSKINQLLSDKEIEPINWSL